MEKFKICPSCGVRNSPQSFDCTSCETDLTSVRVLDEETEKGLIEKQNEIQSAETETVRICDCGEKNPPNARKCSFCGEDIFDILPTVDTSDSTKYILSSIDGEYAFEINKPAVTVGREHGMKEYLYKKSYVSRTHAKITMNGDKLIVENLSGTNFTYANNKKISLGERAELKDGDELGFGGFIKNGERQPDAAYFLVRIVSCI